MVMNGKKLTILIFCVIFSMDSVATEDPTSKYDWGLHLFSLHTKSGFNNFNPGIYVQHHTGWTAGAFRNSYSRASVYGGYMWRKQRCGGPELFLGAATGYEDDTGSSKGLAPVFAPSYSWCLDGVVSAARLSWFVDPRKDAAQALHVSISFR